MGGEILFLAHRLPFPPDRGDRIRSCNILKALVKIAPVHVGCFVDSDEDRAHTAELAQYARTWCIAKRSKPLPVAGAESLLRREPVSLSAFRSEELSRWVRTMLASGQISAVYVFSGQMGQFVPASWQGRLVVDLVDVDSAKFDAYALEAAFPQSMIHAREGRLLSSVEGALAAKADHTLLVSEEEAQLLRDRIGEAGNVGVLGNGIDAEFFNPAGVAATPDMAGKGPHFLFTGQMDYPPNVAAVKRMAQSILPAIRDHHANAQFHIVGRAPTGEVDALGELAGVTVHGSVPDMRPYLAGADIVVAPLTLARGIQNKVLEAMAMARPVVASEEAATGIPARDGEHFLIASGDTEFISKSLELLSNSQKANDIAIAARTFVQADCSWEARLAALPELMGFAEPNGEQRDAA